MKKLSHSPRLSYLLLAIAGVVLFAGCGKKSALSTKNQVVWWQISDIERLNPLIAQEATGQYVEQEVWESLFAQNPRTLENIPLLASLPEVAPDHLTYTFTLNPKAHWSDGKPVTGDDVIFSFKTVLNPLIVDLKPLANYFLNLDSAYFPGGDHSKIAFHVNKPYFQEDIVLGGGYVKIIPKHIWDPQNLSDQLKWSDFQDPNTKNPVMKQLADFFSDPKHDRDPKMQIGSGPYIFTDWQTGDHVTLKRDPNYWAWSIPWFEAYPDTIILKTISDRNAALAALKKHDIDVMQGLTAQMYLSNLDPKKFPEIHKDTVYFNAYSFIAWNCEKPIFSSKITRRALTELIDREQILHSLLKDQARLDDGPIVFTQPNYDPSIKQPGFNVDDAKKLLAQDGWTDSDGDGILDKVINGKKTNFAFTFLDQSGDDIGQQILLVIIEQLRKAGIKADIQMIEHAVYGQRLRDHVYDATFSGWTGNATEDEIYQLWHSSQATGHGSNYYSFKNAEADKIMEDTRTEFDVKKRYQMSSQLAKIIVDEQPVTFMFATPVRFGWVDRFDNVELFRARPNFDPRYWVVRGADVKRAPNAIPMGVAH